MEDLIRHLLSDASTVMAMFSCLEAVRLYLNFRYSFAITSGHMIGQEYIITYAHYTIPDS